MSEKSLALRQIIKASHNTPPGPKNELTPGIRIDVKSERDKLREAYDKISRDQTPLILERNSLKRQRDKLKEELTAETVRAEAAEGQVESLKEQVIRETGRANAAQAQATAADEQHAADLAGLKALETRNQELTRMLEIAQAQATALQIQNSAILAAKAQSPQSGSTQDSDRTTEAQLSYAQRYQALCESIYNTSTPERGDLSKQAVLDAESRKATGLDYSANQEGQKYGILRLVNALFGRTTSLIGIENSANTLLSTLEPPHEGAVTPERAAQIGRAIDLLSRGDAASELASGLVNTLRGQYERQAGYNSEIQEFFITQASGFPPTENREYSGFFVNPIGTLRTLETTHQQLDALISREPNPILEGIRDKLGELLEGNLVSDLRKLTGTLEVAQSGRGGTPQPINLAGLEITIQEEAKGPLKLFGPKNQQYKAVDYFIQTFKANPQDCDNLIHITRQLSTLLPLARVQQVMRELLPNIAPSTTPEQPTVSDDGSMRVVAARNFHRVLMSAAFEGKVSSTVDPRVFKDFRLAELLTWPDDLSIVNREHLIQAVQNETPQSMELNPKQLITLITGPNGSGKTSVQNNIAETLAYAEVIRQNPNAKVVKLSDQLSNIRISGPAMHSNQLSTFQGEAKFISEALEALKPGDVLFVDEVGRGTDSRDAIALTIGIMTYCIRNNIHALVATHYGNKLFDLTKKFGIQDQIRMMSMDPKTRQLVDSEAAAASLGIEVFKTRGEADGLSPLILDTLVANAKEVRDAVLTGKVPELTAYPDLNARRNPMEKFADRDTLDDLGYNFTYSYTTRLNRSAVISRILDATASKIAAKDWNRQFEDKARAIYNSEPQILAREHAVIDSLANLFTLANVSELTVGSAACSDTYHDLFPGVLDLNKTMREYRVSQQNNYDQGPSEAVNSAHRFLEAFGDPTKRRLHFEKVQALCQIFIQSGQPLLVELGTRMQTASSEARSRIDQTLQPYEQTNRDEQTLYTALRNKAALAINQNLVNMSSTYSHEQELFAHELAATLGETVSNPATYFSGLATRIQQGDTRAYAFFTSWIVNKKPQYGSLHYVYEKSGAEDLFKLTEEIDRNRQNIINRGNLPLGINTTQTFQSQIFEKLFQGDTSALMDLTTAFTKSRSISNLYYGGADTVKRIETIQAEKALLCLQAVSDLRPASAPLSEMAYYGTMTNAIKTQGWSKVTYSDDGTFQLNHALPLTLLQTKPNLDQLEPMSYSIPGGVDASLILGINGGGKTQLLLLAGGALVQDRLTGYTTGENPVLPKDVEFVACLVNAGESTENRSSFQNEADRYIKLLKAYTRMGAPRNGYIFVDEPFASTSSEDQVGLSVAIAHFFKSRGVKIVYTNHNHQTYPLLRQAGIDFSVAGFIKSERGIRSYSPVNYDPDKVDEIKSEGIMVAGEFGIPDRVFKVATLTRQIIDEEEALARAA
jgi:ABC-type cobalamin/Fe3+-siderophores transport system ATPase subunit